MAVLLPDTASPMADFPVAMAEHIQFSDGEKLQEKFDSGSLGGGGTINPDDLLDYVSKTNDVVSTYTGDETDTNKIPDLASMQALENKLQESINGIINVGGVEIYDGLDSTSTVAALSAKQGKVLDEKISGKFDTTQSSDNAGLVVSVGNDGNLTFVDPSTFVPDIEIPVTSVNGLTGDVEITTSSLGAVSNDEFGITNTKVLGMEITISELQLAVEGNTDDIADVLTLAEANQIAFNNLTAQVTQASADASNALTKAEAAETTVSAQQSTVSNLTNQIVDLQAAADRHDADISVLETDVASKANIVDVYSKTQVDTMISGSVSSVYKYKGNVDTVAALATAENPENGHVYFVTEDSLNYAYMDGNWNPLAGIIDLSDYVREDDFTTALAGKANTADIKTKTSQLENDEKFVTETQMEAAMSAAGVGAVQTVNGKYGNVILDASDVGAVSSEDLNVVLSSYYNKDEVDTMFGDIEAVLDIINGETV